MNIQELIKKLQGEKQYCFGMLEKEEQALIRELNKKQELTIQVYTDEKWSHSSNHWALDETSTYRISPSYTEPIKNIEPEFKYYPVETDLRDILCIRVEHELIAISILQSFINFVSLEVQILPNLGWHRIDLPQARSYAKRNHVMRAKFRKNIL